MYWTLTTFEVKTVTDFYVCTNSCPLLEWVKVYTFYHFFTLNNIVKQKETKKSANFLKLKYWATCSFV